MSKNIFIIITVLLFWGCLPDPVSNTTTIYFQFNRRQIFGEAEEVVKSSNPRGGFGIVGTKSTDGDFSNRRRLGFVLIKIDEQVRLLEKTYGGSADDFGFSLVESRKEDCPYVT